jgi:hypothetical protein
MIEYQTADRDAAGIEIPVRIKLLHRAPFVAERATFGFELIKHVPAVFTVVTAGIGALQTKQDGGSLALAAAELVAGAFVLVVVGAEARHLFGRGSTKGFASPDAHASHERPRIDLANLAAAALGFVESWHRTHVTGHFKLVSPQIVGGTTSLLLALGGQRSLQKRRSSMKLYIAVTPGGIRYKAGPRTSWRANWTDVDAIETSRDEIAFRLKNGKRRVLRADTFFDGEAVLAGTRAAIATYAPAHLAGALGAALPPAPAVSSN